MVMRAVTGSPCLVKIRIPAPIMLKPMNVPMPKARTMSVPKMLMLKETPKIVNADKQGKLLLPHVLQMKPQIELPIMNVVKRVGETRTSSSAHGLMVFWTSVKVWSKVSVESKTDK